MTRHASFKVKGRKPAKGSVAGLEITFLGAKLPTSVTPTAGYADKVNVDIQLEKLQTRSKTKGRLGSISGLAGLPASERFSVKYAIWQYFGPGSTRNAEVDVIVPIAGTTKNVYYTLRFKPTSNDVEIERVGVEGKGSVKPERLDVARVAGFAANSKSPAKLLAWMKSRYPGMAVTGKSVPNIRTNANKKMRADAGKPDWFKKNYGIEVLDAGGGETRMETVHGWPGARRRDIKDYAPSDLRKLELSLQTMSPPILAILKGVHMVRQDAYMKKSGGRYRPVAKTAGTTFRKGSHTTVVIFDRFTRSERLLFSGGTKGVRPASTETFVHEFGHVLVNAGGIAKKFDAFVKKHKIKPVSWYAASGKSEAFPEAFAFFQLDPEWMKRNQPKLHKWFVTLSKTGKPPP